MGKMAPTYKQAMPPTGGFGSIQYARNLTPGTKGWKAFGGLFALTSVSWTIYTYQRRVQLGYEAEMNDARVALEPFMFAEQDRQFLRHLWNNREEERELMKNVPGWKVGTWYGEPVYHQEAKREKYVQTCEYFAHNAPEDHLARQFHNLWQAGQ